MPEGAPAARAGVHVSDLVQSINGRAVESIGDVTALVRSLDPGRTVTMALRRGTKAVEVRVQLGATHRMTTPVTTPDESRALSLRAPTERASMGPIRDEEPVPVTRSRRAGRSRS